jgi:hypothetical protein
LPWPSEHFDVVIGNPPWTEPARGGRGTADKWAAARALPVGDRNPSQLFLWRALSFLNNTGYASLLVGAPAFYNSRQKSREFRYEWLAAADVQRVVNFTEVRKVFFSGAIAPFLMINFKRHEPSSGRRGVVTYHMARPSTVLDRTVSLAFARLDRRLVQQELLRQHDYLWKVYGWGNHHDAALISRLRAESALAAFLPLGVSPGYGYQRGTNPPSKVLRALPSLKTFTPWGPLDDAWFEGRPRGVKRDPPESLYRGQRIIVRQGVTPGFGPYARLTSRDFSFRHTIYSIPLPRVPGWKAKTLLGILLSSLGRYTLFMLSGSWGIWHDCVVAQDIMNLPVRLPGRDDQKIRKIVAAVDLLEQVRYPEDDTMQYLLRLDERNRRTLRLARSWPDVLANLDDAVYDLFDLTRAERDLVRDFHQFTLDLNHNGSGSSALTPVSLPGPQNGLMTDLDRSDAILSKYLTAFLAIWNRELAPHGEMNWNVVGDEQTPVLAAVFSTSLVGERLLPRVSGDTEASGGEWRELLDRIGDSMGAPLGGNLFAEGIVRVVTETDVIVIKRNEQRLWSPTAAREDAEATLLQAMRLESA